MSKGKKGKKGERNPLEGVTFDQLSDKEKQLARLILQSMETEVEQDAELSLPDAILKYAEDNPNLNFSEKERQLIDKLKSEKSGGQVDAESQKPTFAEQLREGKKNLKHVEPTEKPKASGPSFSELIADKAAEMREKRNANQKKSSTVKDDFLQVTENESGVSNSSLQVSANKPKSNAIVSKPKSNAIKEVQEDTPENRLAAVLGKSGVTLSPEDKAIATEMIHAVGVMDGRSDRVMGKVGTKLQGVGRLIKNYPELKSNADEFCQVFESAAKNPKTIKFMQDNYLNEVREEHGASTTKEQNVEVSTSKPKLKTTNKSSTLAITDGSETQQVNQEQAVDSVIFSPSSKSKGGAKNISTSDAIDPITQAIRDEILKKQQKLLQEKIAETLEGKEKEDFLKQDLTAIRSYLQTEEGKQAVDNAMKSPELRKQMHAIEREGYKTVHTKFQDSFNDVDWGKINEDKVRTTHVKDADGNAVCTLEETNVDTKPQTVKLADGTTQTINKYRKINFPRELETGNGPMHVSMAVRDANGKPISKKEAVYFTAHYDDNGKLTEVSSPTPVHFAGDGPNAIGYIEVDGKVFTLPVTREKYEEMMQEVAKNNGLETQINQSVVQDKSKQNTLALENSPTKKTLAIEDSPSKKPKTQTLAIEDSPNKKTKTQTLAIEDAPNKKPKVVEQESVQEQTEAQKLADKMRKSREARGNESAEPESRGGGKPVNVKTKKPKVVEQESAQEQTEAQKLADKMRKSREARGNESAEPESKGGGKPVNVKTKKPKVVEQESAQEQTEAQKLADKMRKSREARGNESAEPESKGGGKPVNVKTKKPKVVEQESVQEQTEAQKLADKMRKSREARGNESAEPESKGGGKPVNVKTKKPKAVEQESVQEQTEAQKLADKMRKSREARGNESAEPESKGGGKPVNVKTGKSSSVEQESVKEQTEAQKLAEKMKQSRGDRGNESAEHPEKIDSPKQKTEAQGLAEKMKQSRGDRSNESAEPESRGGGKPVNVKKPKVVEKESGPELNEAQKMAKKMKKSRVDRDNVVAEAESRGGGKAVNVKSKPKPKIKPLTLENPDSVSLPDTSNTKKLLGAAKDLAEAVSDLTKNVKAAAQKGSRVNARTGKKVSETIAKLTAHTRGNVDPVIASGKKAKSSGKGVTVSTPNMAQNKSSGHSR